MQVIGQNIDLVVLLSTYNHEEYIEQAINSIVCQKTKYSYILYIVDDASTDNTTKIVKQYQEKFPDIIRCYIQETNVGDGNFSVQKANAIIESKYITYLDGDDYWCTSDKVEKQLDFLESNPDFVSVCHATKTINSDRSQKDGIIKPDLDEWDLCDMIKNEYPLYSHTSSFIRRNIFKKVVPDKFFGSKIFRDDVMLCYAFSEFGKTKYLDEVMSVYRITNKGTCTGKTEQQRFKNYIGLFYTANKYFEYKYYRYFLNSISCAEVHYKNKYCVGISGTIKYYFRSIGVSCRKIWIKINPKRLRKKFFSN